MHALKYLVEKTRQETANVRFSKLLETLLWKDKTTSAFVVNYQTAILFY